MSKFLDEVFLLKRSARDDDKPDLEIGKMMPNLVSKTEVSHFLFCSFNIFYFSKM